MTQPKGTMVVTVSLRLPDESGDHYRAMNHDLKERACAVYQCTNTYEEAQSLIDRLRALNPNERLMASWTGAVLLHDNREL